MHVNAFHGTNNWLIYTGRDFFRYFRFHVGVILVTYISFRIAGGGRGGCCIRKISSGVSVMGDETVVTSRTKPGLEFRKGRKKLFVSSAVIPIIADDIW